MIVRITFDDGSEATFNLEDAAIQLKNGTRELPPKEPLQAWREIELDDHVSIHITGRRAR
jgi:hypothetical protein